MQTLEPVGCGYSRPQILQEGRGAEPTCSRGGGDRGAGLSTRPPAASCITVARPSANRGGHRRSHELTKPLPSLSTRNHAVLPQPLAAGVGWGGYGTWAGHGRPTGQSSSSPPPRCKGQEPRKPTQSGTPQPQQRPLRTHPTILGVRNELL